MKKREIKKNQRFGRLIVIKEVERHLYPNGRKRKQVLCRCDCGREKIVLWYSLIYGYTKSCGCLQKEAVKKTGEKSKTHGLSNHKLFKVFNDMKMRCYNPNRKQYKYYGGRGISICKEWLLDFKAFYDFAISHGWKDGLTIDRIDNNGNYEPSNCRFVGRQIQSQNNRWAKLNPKKVRSIKQMRKANMKIYKIAELLNVERHTVGNVINGNRWQNII